MFALFSVVDERCVVTHQESETDRGLLFNRRTFDTGIIQCCGQAVNFIVTAGQVIAVNGTPVHAQIHQVVRGTLKGSYFFGKSHNKFEL